MSFKKICAIVILVPLGIILLAFIIANRSQVTLNLNIFSFLFGSSENSYTMTAPFFIWIVLFIAIGVFIGYLLTVPKMRKQRKNHNQLQKENYRLEAENARLHKDLMANKAQNAHKEPV